MKNFEIGYIFRDNEEYPEIAKFCNGNNLKIVQIDQDENGRLFQIQGIPPKSEKERLKDEKFALETWFDIYYTQHEQKYRRLQTLGLIMDDGGDAENALRLLYTEAEIKRRRIQEIEVKLQ